MMARLAAVVLAVVTAACASAPARPAALPPVAAVPGFAITDDTFAFRNEIRARHPGATDLYANYCFVLARAVRQFHQFARFDVGAPRVAPEEYVRRVRAVGARAPWPKHELNHTVVAYGYLLRPAGAELTVWDPNDLSGPGTVVFDARADRFVAAHVYETRPGPIRVFRMYYSGLL